MLGDIRTQCYNTGSMENLIEYFRRRATSTFMVAYSAFWAMWHWEGIYTTLFTSQEHIMSQYHILKNEYVARYFFGFSNIQGDFWLGLGWRVLGFIIPAILAYLYVWWLPKFITNPAYKREANYKIDRRIIKNEAELRLSASEKKKTEAETKETSAKIESAKKKEEMRQINPEEGWAVDFDKAILSNRMGFTVDALTALKETIYNYGGRIVSDGVRHIDSDELMFCDANGLVKFQEKNTLQIEITEKGKYFLRQIIDVFVNSDNS